MYQPAGYEWLTSRMGTDVEFQAMVRTCRDSGVKVYVDAVVNSMTGEGEVSYAGFTFGKYTYPDGGVGTLYGPKDFHRNSGDCPTGERTNRGPQRSAAGVHVRARGPGRPAHGDRLHPPSGWPPTSTG